MSAAERRHALRGPRKLSPTAYTVAVVAASVALSLGISLAFVHRTGWWLLLSAVAFTALTIWPGLDAEMTCPDCEPERRRVKGLRLSQGGLTASTHHRREGKR